MGKSINIDNRALGIALLVSLALQFVIPSIVGRIPLVIYLLVGLYLLFLA